MKLARKAKKSLIPHFRMYWDEAGRWPLAGPVTVGIVLPLLNFGTDWFADSKTLTAWKRETLYSRIEILEKEWALLKASGRASNKEIDKHGIIWALRRATIRAIYTVLQHWYSRYLREQFLDSPYGEDKIAVHSFDRIFSKKKWTAALLRQIGDVRQSLFDLRGLIFDGNHDFSLPQRTGLTVKTIIKWDSKNPYISMASIVAKVERDRYVTTVSRRLPWYTLEQHKGYGTATHRKALRKLWWSSFHRQGFCASTTLKQWPSTRIPTLPQDIDYRTVSPTKKPDLLLHICCAPDLTRPLTRLKQHFKLHLFWYNPNIHPRKEHTKRYEQFLKLTGLEPWDYEILEDRYDPKEFFAAMVKQKVTIDPKLKDKRAREVLQVAWEMEEWSSRCNPCYQMRLDQAARMAVQSSIPYFSSTLLISPKKHWGKLFDRWIEGERAHPWTKFLRFDFAKDNGYNKASQLTKKHDLRRQHYCWCWRTVPKAWQKITTYSGW